MNRTFLNSLQLHVVCTEEQWVFATNLRVRLLGLVQIINSSRCLPFERIFFDEKMLSKPFVYGVFVF